MTTALQSTPFKNTPPGQRVTDGQRVDGGTEIPVSNFVFTKVLGKNYEILQDFLHKRKERLGV